MILRNTLSGIKVKHFVAIALAGRDELRCDSSTLYADWFVFVIAFPIFLDKNGLSTIIVGVIKEYSLPSNINLCESQKIYIQSYRVVKILLIYF